MSVVRNFARCADTETGKGVDMWMQMTHKEMMRKASSTECEGLLEFDAFGWWNETKWVSYRCAICGATIEAAWNGIGPRNYEHGAPTPKPARE